MNLFKKQPQINFMDKRQIAMVVSGFLLVSAIILLIVRGINFGIDFTGGTLVEVGYPEAVELSEVRGHLEGAGYGDAIVQQFGTPRDILVRLAPRVGVSDKTLSNDVFKTLNTESGAELELRRVEFVGPQVGDELTEDGGLAMLYALIAISIYVMLRFEWRFSIGALIALVHDVVITIGLFSLLQMEFDLPVLAALLAVIGYSLNDTIVVYDRIRENFRKMRKGSPQQIIDTSLNQTLSRTLVTSLTTMLVLLALFFLGGEIIHGFAFALLVGVIVGTYSSIFLASVAVLMLGINKEDLMPVKKEGAKIDDMP
ncbi:protein-export membrane protein SecF [Solemya velum gill symbiont]|uniref:protein translocase subunit SecF n=1 Tax=Solemya velum gill symbiont TaxID=2340 RepID=UPI000997C647|nr:protein translocase subunit SecF [Solemya velum gill symbiont]OOZ77711.1 protein-export membrane protein SecF [Solemya velum gill symbiont]